MNHDKLRFYWTVASGSTHKALKMARDNDDIPDPENVMVSAATKMNRTWTGPSWFIDSGGYSTLLKNGEYETPIDDYVAHVRNQETRDDVNVSCWALRDWACETDLLRDKDRTTRVHQNWTIRDQVECMDEADRQGVDADPVAVLQGYDVRDYLEHIDRLQDYGLLTDLVGIGSVCRRGKTPEIRATILQVRDALPSRCSIHAFGVKVDVLKAPDVVAAIDSVDTAAWDREANYNPDIEHNSETCLDSYVQYRQRVEELLDNVSDDAGKRRIVSLANFGTSDLESDGPFPLAKCICGQLIDWEYPNLHDPTCRHCQRAVENLDMATDGLLCDPEFGNHHRLCPHDADAESDGQESPAEASAPSPS